MSCGTFFISSFITSSIIPFSQFNKRKNKGKMGRLRRCDYKEEMSNPRMSFFFFYKIAILWKRNGQRITLESYGWNGFLFLCLMTGHKMTRTARRTQEKRRPSAGIQGFLHRIKDFPSLTCPTNKRKEYGHVKEILLIRCEGIDEPWKKSTSCNDQPQLVLFSFTRLILSFIY